MTAMSDGMQDAERYLRSAEDEAWNVPDVPPDALTAEIRKVGVVGAGTMGGGIAMALANAGLPVTLLDTTREALDRGLSVVRRNYGRSRSSTPETTERRMALLTPTLDVGALADCDLVIEAVFETMAVKKAVFSQLAPVVRADAILASNTSYLDIDEMAGVIDHPGRFIGLHFFSPANVMKLLEIVRGPRTSRETVAAAMGLARRIGKVAVLVGVCHGFVGNRMLAQRQREAQALLLEGAMPWQVDRALSDFGFPMGPFAMADLAGLDIGWTRESSTSSSVREVLCEMDRRGQKTGAGFYDYDDQRRPAPSPVVEQVVLDFARSLGVNRREIGAAEILERCLYPLVNEGVKILEEGVALRASDIDVVWANGYGWPRRLGGPMWWADRIGLEQVLNGLRRYEARGRLEFRPCAMLERLVRDGGRLHAVGGLS